MQLFFTSYVSCVILSYVSYVSSYSLLLGTFWKSINMLTDFQNAPRIPIIIQQ
jgi:hypothetical protein